MLGSELGVGAAPETAAVGAGALDGEAKYGRQNTLLDRIASLRVHFDDMFVDRDEGELRQPFRALPSYRSNNHQQIQQNNEYHTYPNSQTSEHQNIPQAFQHVTEQQGSHARCHGGIMAPAAQAIVYSAALGRRR